MSAHIFQRGMQIAQTIADRFLSGPHHCRKKRGETP
jgi:hypothetical protein